MWKPLRHAVRAMKHFKCYFDNLTSSRCSMRRSYFRGALCRRLALETLENRSLPAIVVNTLIDEMDGSLTDGDISLRDAIALAPADSVIEFDPSLFSPAGPQTLLLTLGQLTVAKPLTINGPDASELIIDASAISGSIAAFAIDDGTSSLINVQISGVTITGADDVFFGAVSNSEHLTIANSVISGNSRTGVVSGFSSSLAILDSVISNNGGSYVYGGGVSSSGTLMIDNSTITGNHASDGGGVGIFGGMATIRNTLVSGNYAENSYGGGGIFSSGLGLMISDCTISSNHAINSLHGGGGILYLGSGSLSVSGLSITRTTIADNTASSKGGGVAVFATTGQVSIDNSTISGNSANTTGGGVYSHGETRIQNVTITGNSSAVAGGVQSESLPVLLTNSIISGNTDSTGMTPSDIAGAIDLSSSFNLVGTDSNGSLCACLGNILGVYDPLLGPLQDNGGTTWTHHPLANSPAINAGRTTALYSPSEFDQRGDGYIRVLDGRIDMGAVETPGEVVETMPVPNVDLIPNPDFEDFIAIPDTITLFDGYVAGWERLTGGTVDYFHVCGFMGNETGIGFATPPPNASDAFIGLLHTLGTYYEYAVIVLPSPLRAGTLYQVDLFAGSTTGGVYGAFEGELHIYGLIDASLVSGYQSLSGFSGSIEEFANGNVVELLSISVNAPLSTWVSFLDQTFVPPGDIEAIVIGTSTAGYLLVDAADWAEVPELLGDYNRDGYVDGGDYVRWRNSLGQTGVALYAGADGNGNGTIDIGDYSVWKSHYGDSLEMAASVGRLSRSNGENAKNSLDDTDRDLGNGLIGVDGSGWSNGAGLQPTTALVIPRLNSRFAMRELSTRTIDETFANLELLGLLAQRAEHIADDFDDSRFTLLQPGESDNGFRDDYGFADTLVNFSNATLEASQP